MKEEYSNSYKCHYKTPFGIYKTKDIIADSYDNAIIEFNYRSSGDKLVMIERPVRVKIDKRQPVFSIKELLNS